MSEFTTLMARDGHEFSAWLAAPPGKPRGAVLVIQEIFGVNAHIRAVTDSYAAEGYVAIAPAVFDRVRKGIELGYNADTMKEGFGYVQQLKRESTLLDLAASVAVVKHAGRVGVVGFCWGGRMAYVTACELPVACGVAYYGGGIAQELGKTPKCPMLYHFGGQDSHIPASDVDKIRAADTRGTFYVYPDADHGFNCDMRASFNQPAAQLARQRTLAFLAQHLRGEPAQPHA
ncbi:MAG TPA: dienelactone hydrolase family protein [Steroidobacteraceae bacterium]|nr:dienelactone hydrolase family protein [Steroidobacteraceae bacterium]